MPFYSPGATFAGGFNDFFLQKAQQDHQNLLDTLAQKREARMAQAELDTATERQDELQRKKEKDQQDVHDRLEKHFNETKKDMVKGDRYSPEQIDEAKQLHISLFQQAPPPMSTAVGAPPAALMTAPPPGATAEGGLPTPAGAMQPQVNTFPGTPKEREHEQNKTEIAAFIQKLRDAGDTVRADELANAYEAEGLGLKTPPGYFSKTGASGDQEAVFQQNPRSGSIQRLQNGQWVDWNGDVPKGAHFMTIPAPKDTSAREAANEQHLQTAKEHAFKRIYDEMGKGELGKITASDDLATALTQNSPAADATLAPLILKASITTGGGSGFRMTRPEIEAVLTKPVWDALKLKLDAWTGEGPLVVTPEQRQAMKKLGRAIRQKAAASMSMLNDAEDEINAADNPKQINDKVLKLKRRFTEMPVDEKQSVGGGGNTAPTGQVNYDASGMLIRPQGAQ